MFRGIPDSNVDAACFSRRSRFSFVSPPGAAPWSAASPDATCTGFSGWCRHNQPNASEASIPREPKFAQKVTKSSERSNKTGRAANRTTQAERIAEMSLDSILTSEVNGWEARSRHASECLSDLCLFRYLL